MAASEAIQKISRLTPLADVQLMIDAEVKAVTQRPIDVSAGVGRTLAVDALAPARPAAALALQDVKDKLSDRGMTIVGGSPEAFTAFIRSETDRWSKVVKARGIKIE